MKWNIVKPVSVITAILVLLGMFYSIGSRIDTRYAIAVENQKDHQAISKALDLSIRRLDIKILQDKSEYKQNQKRALEEKNITKKSINEWSAVDRDNYLRLQKEIKDLDKELDSLPKIN